jgi:hypothetical protein
MKIFKVLLVVAIALGMMACNNEQDVPEIIDGPEATVSIKVMPTSNGPSVRSVGDLTDGQTTVGLATESEIKTLEVWIFENGNLTGYKEGSGNTVDEIPTVAGLMKIVVVANANIGSKPTLAELLAEVKALPAKDVIEANGTGLIMTAEPFELTLKPGNNYYGFADGYGTAPLTPTYHSVDTPLPITRVNARVALVGVSLDYNNVPENQKLVFDALKDVQVAMFNVPNQTKLFGPSLATNTAFQFGAKWASPDVTYVGADADESVSNPTLYDEAVDANALPIVPSNAPFYYVNENTSTEDAQKMFIVLRAKVYKGSDLVTSLVDLYTDKDGYTYYPVWVNANKDGYTYAEGYVADGKVLRNTQYNINLTIKGLGRPTIDEVEDAWLDVNVSVAPWAVVTQNVVW